MPTLCLSCNSPIPRQRKKAVCISCARVCECGAPKDHRALHCRSCTSKMQALAQWSRPESAQLIRSGIAQSGKSRRQTFDRLTASSFTSTKPDGRKYSFYWLDGKKKYIYRYQWVWIINNGPIPKGHEIHHVNEDSTDDRIENLQCIPAQAHRNLHGTSEWGKKLVLLRGGKLTGKTKYVCQCCSKEFVNYPRGTQPRKYCSQECARKCLKSSLAV